MVGFPRRTRPTFAPMGERERTILTQSGGPQSGQGSTADARSPKPTMRQATILPVNEARSDRLKVNWFSNSPNITTDLTGSKKFIPSWPSIFEQSGTSVGLNPAGDDGGIYFFDAGVYAVSIILQVGANVAGSLIRFSAQIESGDFDQFDVVMRDGDWVPGFGASPGTSRTFWSDGGGVDGGGVGFTLAYVNPDNGWGQVWVEALVQRVA